MNPKSLLPYLPVVLIAALGIWVTGRGPSDADIATTRQALAQEFQDAYPEKATPTGNLVEYTLEAKEGKVKIINDIETTVWSYNNSVPGPILRATLGDTIRITFTNNLPQPTTVHWHGMRVPNDMDGAPFVTQEPVKPGETFTYEFTPKDAGTFWYHPHVRGHEQVERGLFGAIIIDEPESEQLAFTQEATWVVDDWKLTEEQQLSETFGSIEEIASEGRLGNVITVNARTDTTLIAAPGERLRLRLVNSSNARIYNPQFPSEFIATGFATDGMVSRETFSANGYEFGPGNRLDVDLTIPADIAPGTYQVTDTYNNQSNNLATITVTGEPVATPDFSTPTNPNVPHWTEAADMPLDKEYDLYLTRDDERVGGESVSWLTIPVAQAHEEHLEAIPEEAQTEFENALVENNTGYEWHIEETAYDNAPGMLSYNQFSKLRFTNNSDAPHPMHIHGAFFQKIAQNNESLDEGRWLDTVIVHPGDTVDIGIVPIDKGEWMFHCHILSHAEFGMMSTITVQ